MGSPRVLYQKSVAVYIGGAQPVPPCPLCDHAQNDSTTSPEQGVRLILLAVNLKKSEG